MCLITRFIISELISFNTKWAHMRQLFLLCDLSPVMQFFPHFIKAMVKWMAIVRVFHFVKFCYPFPIFPRARRWWGNFWFTNEGFPLPLPQIQIASCNATTLSPSDWVGSWQKPCLLVFWTHVENRDSCTLQVESFQYTSGLSSYMSLSPPATHWVSLHFSYVASAQSQQLLIAWHIFWSLALHLFFSFL